MSDLRKFQEVVEDLEEATIVKYLRRSRYAATIALQTARGKRDIERCEFIKTAIAAIDDAIDPHGDLEEELRELMEGNGG